MELDAFIGRWAASGGSERANFQQFAIELTQLLGVEAPLPATEDRQNDGYRFERPVKFTHTDTQSRGYIDLYKRGCFVMEAKQGSRPVTDDNQAALFPDLPPKPRRGHGARGTGKWDDTMLRAKGQADSYARAVSRDDGWPPFLLIVDVGHVIEVYADFSGQGQGYTQFPDKSRYRITMDDLRRPEIQNQLRTIWTAPLTLDPAKVSARVTREVAGHLAELGKSFEGQGHASDDVARFLMRCLFAMFAEDVRLIPENSFRDLLAELRGRPQDAMDMLSGLFREMDGGGMSHVLRKRIPKFNGGLFADATALPLNEVQLHLLILAANCDWKTVEPAIFGTLLERALDSRQRHKLGAHYTPRAYVERLVTPVVIEPLRREWEGVKGAVVILAQQNKQEEAMAEVRRFHRRLCDVRVLDPACGSGNFLYVALEMMKRLEGEVTALLAELGDDQTALQLAGHTVDPHQFLGIEVNPWAAAVAELVLWIGYLQWHFRTYGSASPAEPVLKNFHNIENRDAVLAWDDRRPRLDADGKPVTRWDGIGTIEHPVTGERVPDPEARVQVWDYIKPRPASWPEADFIVGNPPFIGASRMRDALGDGYTEAIRKAYPKVPDSADFVMFWWEKAALAARAYSKGKGCRRFGLITTNSLRQTFNRKVLDNHLNDPKTPLGIIFAIPDHPWVDAGDGAAVRIAMTVGEKGRIIGRLLSVLAEEKTAEGNEGRDVALTEVQGTIQLDLRVGPNVVGVVALKANEGLAIKGMQLNGQGFVMAEAEAKSFLNEYPEISRYLRPYINGADLKDGRIYRRALDLYPLTQAEVRTAFPRAFQHLQNTVKPERDQNPDPWRRDNWHWFGRTHRTFREATSQLTRYIGTTRTAKFRLFSFVDVGVISESKVVIIASDSAADLAVLSSKWHVHWALVAGGMLGVGNDPTYNHTDCFNPFPFPEQTGAQSASLCQLGEELDAHRKDRQIANPKLTLTAMYNVLEKLRSGKKIEGKDREIYEQGLIGILKDIHDRIDAAVADAYGWPADLTDDDILHRLVALNQERQAEEAKGIIRWLRPEYQNPTGKGPAAEEEQSELDIGTTISPDSQTPWPKTLPEQIALVRKSLEEIGPANTAELTRRFKKVRTSSVEPLVQTLVALGVAHPVEGDRYRV